jgi:hypothetical protein
MMTAKTNKPAQTLSEVVKEFFALTSEFADSAMVVLVPHPIPNQNTPHLVAIHGNPYAFMHLSGLYVNGQLPDGSWYAGPGGVATAASVYGELCEEIDLSPDDGAVWADVISDAVEQNIMGLAASLGPCSGLLVLATCGEGPPGNVPLVVRSFGNTMAIAGAVSQWMDRHDL